MHPTLLKVQELLNKYRQALELASAWVLYDIDFESVKKLDAEIFKDAAAYLEEGHAAWLEWRRIRKEQDEKRWEWYANDPESYSGFPEVILHRNALRQVRTYFFTKERPLLFHKKKVEKLLKRLEINEN